MMGKADTYNLGKLSDEDCWRLLSSIAFPGEKSENLERIGWKIANKCKGVPLSAKTLGGLLRFRKPTIQDWQDVLESEIWELQEVEKEILPSLLLSYYDLPSHMKRCFLYCAIFPKDDKIEKEKLINLWMAQGFLDESSMGRRTSNPDMTGELYLNNLVMRSFLQDVSEKYKAMYSIHDLLHDLAQYLTRNDCYVVSATSIKLEDFNSSKARHLTLILNGGNMDSVFPSTSTLKAKKNLRTFQVLMNPGKYDYISLTTSIVNIFKHFTCLRALDLSKSGLTELQLREVDKLIHLRYLDSSWTELRELPETISNLYNLQTLIVEHCWNLCKLPEGIGRMLKLRHLQIDRTDQLSCLPQGIGKLSSLRTLSNFVVGDLNTGAKGGGCKIDELKGLTYLQGELTFEGLKNVADGEEASRAELHNKPHLRGLVLFFNGVYGENRLTEKRTEDVLENLNPHPNLERLEIRWYPSAKFPNNWLMMKDPEFLLSSNLQSLELQGCMKCTQLPSTIAKLPFLEELNVSGMEDVINMSCEFFGVDDGSGEREGWSRKLFPRLKLLYISSMPNLEEVIEVGRRAYAMPPEVDYVVLPQAKHTARDPGRCPTKGIENW
ncbi:PREDICTED: putative disease resistance RPP13-like protein 1 [Nelumbo nucifera]|nr:PREDICTED: putative disease resistance RPP13-like protein 1 [Nelumbo nucifera]